ncbi:MAG: hypothetical protein AVDCRST_MAG76-167, partial [uncultured Acidimicrobiales bacterium]
DPRHPFCVHSQAAPLQHGASTTALLPDLRRHRRARSSAASSRGLVGHL